MMNEFYNSYKGNADMLSGVALQIWRVTGNGIRHYMQSYE